MIRGPFLTRLYMCNWIRANVAYRIEEVKVHDCWPRLCTHVSAMTKTHLKQAQPSSSSSSSTVSCLICDSTVDYLIYSSVMPPFCVLSTHIYIVTYVHCSCTGNAPFCIYY